jgi:hypothetical protein
MSKHFLVLTALVLAVFLAWQTPASAQQLRGPMMATTPARLLPRFPSGLLNNGSLQTTQNPNANLPNQAKFIYIAAMPLGDRLGNNGVYYDTDLLPNLGLFQGGQNLYGQVNQNNNNINNPIQPPPVQAARMARQRMMMAMYAYYYQQMMMQAYYDAMMASNDPSTSGFPSMNSSTSYGSPGSFSAPMNNAGFGAGFQKNTK